MIYGSVLQKKLAKSALAGTVIGMATFFVLLFATTNDFAKATVSKTSTIGVWKLQLLEISKAPIDGGGYALSFQFLKGFLVYWVIVLLVSSLVAITTYFISIRNGELHKQ